MNLKTPSLFGKGAATAIVAILIITAPGILCYEVMAQSVAVAGNPIGNAIGNAAISGTVAGIPHIQASMSLGNMTNLNIRTIGSLQDMGKINASNVISMASFVQNTLKSGKISATMPQMMGDSVSGIASKEIVGKDSRKLETVENLSATAEQFNALNKKDASEVVRVGRIVFDGGKEGFSGMGPAMAANSAEAKPSVVRHPSWVKGLAPHAILDESATHLGDLLSPFSGEAGPLLDINEHPFPYFSNIAMSAVHDSETDAWTLHAITRIAKQLLSVASLPETNFLRKRLHAKTGDGEVDFTKGWLKENGSLLDLYLSLLRHPKLSAEDLFSLSLKNGSLFDKKGQRNASLNKKTLLVIFHSLENALFRLPIHEHAFITNFLKPAYASGLIQVDRVIELVMEYLKYAESRNEKIDMQDVLEIFIMQRQKQFYTKEFVIALADANIHSTRFQHPQLVRHITEVRFSQLSEWVGTYWADGPDKTQMLNVLNEKKKLALAQVSQTNSRRGIFSKLIEVANSSLATWWPQWRPNSSQSAQNSARKPDLRNAFFASK